MTVSSVTMCTRVAVLVFMPSEMSPLDHSHIRVPACRYQWCHFSDTSAVYTWHIFGILSFVKYHFLWYNNWFLGWPDRCLCDVFVLYIGRILYMYNGQVNPKKSVILIIKNNIEWIAVSQKYIVAFQEHNIWSLPQYGRLPQQSMYTSLPLLSAMR